MGEAKLELAKRAEEPLSCARVQTMARWRRITTLPEHTDE